jgi:hypothetical protein
VQGVLTQAPQHTSDPRALQAQNDTIQAVEARMPFAQAQLEQHGARVAWNGGERLNCLILSLLQHATATYTPPNEQMLQTADQLRTQLRLGDGMLYSDDRRFGRLVDRINEIYRDAHLNVTVAIPASGGGFIATNYNSLETNHVLVLQGGLHYQAVTMASRPLRQERTQQVGRPRTASESVERSRRPSRRARLM